MSDTLVGQPEVKMFQTRKEKRSVRYSPDSMNVVKAYRLKNPKKTFTDAVNDLILLGGRAEKIPIPISKPEQKPSSIYCPRKKEYMLFDQMRCLECRVPPHECQVKHKIVFEET